MLNFIKSRKISLTDILNLFILLVVLVFFIVSLPENPYFIKPLLVLVAAWISIWGAVAGRRVHFSNKVIEGIKRFYLNFYPLIFLFIMFESFFMILPYFNPNLLF